MNTSQVFTSLGSSVEMIADGLYALYRYPLHGFAMIGRILYARHPLSIYLYDKGFYNVHIRADHAVATYMGVRYVIPYPPSVMDFLRNSWKYADLFGYVPRSGHPSLSFVNACTHLRVW